MADLTERFQAQVARFGSSMAAADRQAFTEQTLRLESAAAGWTRLRWQFRGPLVVLLIVVGFILLIACANVANLLLARAAARRKEIAVRMALGSGRKRLVRQLLTESLLLAGSGGLLGLGVAFLGGRLVAAFMEGQDVVLGVSPDTRVLGFTAVISLASALLFGLMPSMTATRGDLNSWLGEQSRATAGAGRLTIHNAIVVFQIALSVVVLIAAGLFGRTLTNLQQLDTGYAPENLTVFGIDVPGGYDSDRRAALYRAVVDTLEASPGTKASYSAFGVLSGNGLSDPVGTPGYSPRSGESLRAYGTIVSPGFFEATGARIVFGRDFERADDGSPVRVAVVNQAMARRVFGERPLGRRFTLPGLFPNESFEVVGVAADSAYRNLRTEAQEAIPSFYLPFSQPPGASIGVRMRNIQVEVRTSAQRSGVETMIRRTLREVDPAVALTELQPTTAIIDQAMARERLLARLALGFGVLALALGAIGIYGVRSYAVSRRTNEIGVRVALGATASQVLGLVMGQGVRAAAPGIILGLVAAAGLTRFVEGLLFRVAPLDPATFASVAVLFGGVAMAASYVPARRAARVDPAVTLRSE
jgi:predicted permease